MNHTPVLLDSVLHYLQPRAGGVYFDGTFGMGGMARAILNHKPAQYITTDKDEIAEQQAQTIQNPNLQFIRGSFANIAEYCAPNSLDGILLDLGVSSPQLDSTERGFSFKFSAPLDMRMDNRQQLSAQDIINNETPAQLTHIFKYYGEEPRARQLAGIICKNRPITNAKQLADLIAQHSPKNTKTHPATKIFQALRIVVNNELGDIELFLQKFPPLVKNGGRVVIISFHSLEDRLIKNAFKGLTHAPPNASRHIPALHNGGQMDLEFMDLTPKPVGANDNEIGINPRSRSAKLRAIIKK